MALPKFVHHLCAQIWVRRQGQLGPLSHRRSRGQTLPVCRFSEVAQLVSVGRALHVLQDLLDIWMKSVELALQPICHVNENGDRRFRAPISNVRRIAVTSEKQSRTKNRMIVDEQLLTGPLHPMLVADPKLCNHASASA